MIPTLRKLPNSVRTLICASTQINSFHKAVQELVFNALDADASSIAVRINIDDGSIQVVDNGCGIAKSNFKNIGQNYMTSKLVDISTLKSAPNKYGFQGQSLANLAQISETVKVISRFHEYETTYVKLFEKGKAKLIVKGNSRPSKGTTIEIKGFLFNLNIQKKSVDSMNELQNIKTFLEHLSLVHTSISLSLRDDSKNEIIYKIHKNRDIYQTLYTLYEIDKSNVQELQVEKNEYKVKAYVGKKDDKISKQLIFLNGKCINEGSLLHKRVNHNLSKLIRGINKKINKNTNNDEETIFGSSIPFYFIFLTCPYMDYELTNRVLEFKDWAQVNTILDKLVKFYMGDTQLQPVPTNQISNIKNKNKESTNNHIENIIQKILGNHNKKPAISQMQNGIKGKLIKRKPKNKKGESKTRNPVKVRCRQVISTQNLGENAEEQNRKDDLILRIEPQRRATNNQHKHSSSNLSNIPIGNSKYISMRKKENSKGKKLPKRLHRSNNGRLLDNKRYDDRHNNIKKIYLNEKFALETESVKQRCKLLAEETEKLLQQNIILNPDVVINENVQYTCSNFVNGNKNLAVRTKVNEIVIHEYIRLPTKLKAGKCIGNDQLKSNYDLLKTIINTQQETLQESERKQAQDYLVPKTTKPDLIRKLNKTKPNFSLFGAMSPEINCELREQNNNKNNEYAPCNSNTLSINKSKDTYLPKEKHFKEGSSPSANYVRKSISLDTPECNLGFVRELERSQSSLQPDTPCSNIKKSLSDTSPFQAATFQSHNYERIFQSSLNVEPINIYKKTNNFITTQSIENFLNIPNDNRFNTRRGLLAMRVQTNNQKRKCNKTSKLMHINSNKNPKHNTMKETRDSYTIEFTERNENENRVILGNKNETMYTPTRTNYGILEELDSSSSSLKKGLCMKPRTLLMLNENTDEQRALQHETLNQNTFTIDNLNTGSNNIELSLFSDIYNFDKTYLIDNVKEACYDKHEALEHLKSKNENINCVFKSQENSSDKQIIDPITVCETVFNNQELSNGRDTELNISFDCEQDYLNHNDIDTDKMETVQNKLNNTMDFNITSKYSDEKNILTRTGTQKEITETSHHFTLPNSNISKKQDPVPLLNLSPIHEAQEKIPLDKPDTLITNKTNAANSKALNEQHDNNEPYSIRNRMGFVPKGMSPIFQKHHTKSLDDFDPNKEYYTDKIYDNFLKKVKNDTEIFKPGILDTCGLTARDSRIKRQENDEAPLKFDGECIKNAKVLGQVDLKFISAIMKCKSNSSGDINDFLVFFDQHAVHERIRLEKNLADYLIDASWKSVTIDKVSLKMTKDEIIFLHNYRDKFIQFGLQWSIVNQNEISIIAIPEGILGKNPRQVDKIIKAVKNLIKEEIHIIQMQRGCVSIYPKSIMELVFSEACRYAVKFGDYLPKSRCMELLTELAACKTPFQCAHGRPSMAVIMNIEDSYADYEVNYKKVQQFKKFNNKL